MDGPSAERRGRPSSSAGLDPGWRDERPILGPIGARVKTRGPSLAPEARFR